HTRAPTRPAPPPPDRLHPPAHAVLAAVPAAPIPPYAVDADVADTVLALDADTVSLATPGEQHVSVDPARKLFTAVAGEALGTVDDAQRGAAEDLGALVTAPQAQGLGRMMLEMSV